MEPCSRDGQIIQTQWHVPLTGFHNPTTWGPALNMIHIKNYPEVGGDLPYKADCACTKSQTIE